MPQGTMDRLVLLEFLTLEPLPYLPEITLHRPLHFVEERVYDLYDLCLPVRVDMLILLLTSDSHVRCHHRNLWILATYKCCDEAVEEAVEKRFLLCRIVAQVMDLENSFGSQMKEQEKENASEPHIYRY